MTVKIDIVSEYKDKGAKAAEKSMDKLGKSAKNLAVALGVGFSVQKIVQFGKASVAEFQASEVAAQKLQNVLKNTGQLMAFPDTIAGLNNLSKLSGVADDMLTPAFQQLYMSTGDANLALKDLNLAINVSRGSSNDLNTVVDALSKGYAGNTKGLAALNIGLNKAYLATGDMAGITEQLNKQFKGASASYLDTYAGKIQLVKNQFEDMKQIVGQGIVLAAQQATGDVGIGGVTKAMENFGYFTAAATIKLGYLIDKLNSIPMVGGLLDRVVQGWSYLLGVDEVRMQLKNEEWRRNTEILKQAYEQAEAQRKANEEYQKFLKKQKALAAAAAKKEADQAKLKKAGTLMDLDRIQIVAALQNKVSEDERLRLNLQLAIITENADMAKKLSEELLLSQARTTGLAGFIAALPKGLDPFADYPDYVRKALAELAKVAAAINGLPSTTIATTTGGGTSASYIGSAAEIAAAKQISNAQGSRIRMEMSNPESGYYNPTLFGPNNGGGDTYNITVNGATTDLLNQLTTGQLNNNASGSFNTLGSAAG